MKFPGLIIIGVTLALSAPAGAQEEMDCNAPDAPSLPESFAGKAQSDTLKASIETYLNEHDAYNQCLIAYVEANRETLSDQQIEALRKSYTEQQEKTRELGIGWNALYGEWLKENGEA